MRAPVVDRGGEMKVLAIGPLPPPIGGIARLVQGLLGWLATRHNVEVVDTTKWHAGGAGVYARDVLEIWSRIGHADVATYHPGGRGFVYMAPLLVVLCRLRGIPLVIHSSGGTKARAYLDGGVVQRMLIRVTLGADALLFETKGQVEFYRKLVDDDRVYWFPNNRDYGTGEDSNRSKPAQGRAKAVFVGHVNRSKGVGLICDAVESLDRGDVHVDVFGPIREEGLEARMEQTEGVDYRGILEPESVVDVIREYDVLLLPTTHYGEGYPGVLLEAFAAGVPVITTRWRDIPEIVDDGGNGLLVPPDDSEAVADAIRRLISDEPLYERLVAGTLESRERFGRERWGAALESILEASVDRSTFAG